MKDLRKLFFIGCLLISFFTTAQESFPQNWLGHYKGDLLIYDADSVRIKLIMELSISKTNVDSLFDWSITYDFKNKKDVRAYSLVLVDRTKGYYKIDERNSIEIDSYLHNGNILTSFYKVEESYIIASYTKIEETIVFEIIAGKSTPISTTGNQMVNEEEIPQVDTFPVNGRQKAILVKQ